MLLYSILFLLLYSIVIIVYPCVFEAFHSMVCNALLLLNHLNILCYWSFMYVVFLPGFFNFMTCLHISEYKSSWHVCTLINIKHILNTVKPVIKISRLGNKNVLLKCRIEIWKMIKTSKKYIPAKRLGNTNYIEWCKLIKKGSLSTSRWQLAASWVIHMIFQLSAYSLVYLLYVCDFF